MMNAETTEMRKSRCAACGQAFVPEKVLFNQCPSCMLASALTSPNSLSLARPQFAPPKIEDLAPLFPQLVIEQLIGVGGMSAVYKATQSTLARTVALKILPEELAAVEDRAARFRREARLLAQLNHPNIVQVYDSGRVGPWTYILMEYVPGTNLRGYLGSHRLAEFDALRILQNVCEGLEHAHRLKVIHRDIKPENILLSDDGQIKLVDFGLATSMADQDSKSKDSEQGQAVGTPHYVAPEQSKANNESAVDHRADIYSLGIVLYEMLTGDVPKGFYALPSQIGGTSKALDQVVEKAMTRLPEERFSSVVEMKNSLIQASRHSAQEGELSLEQTSSISKSTSMLNIVSQRMWQGFLSLCALVAGLIGFVGLGNCMDWLIQDPTNRAQLFLGFPLFAAATATSCFLALFFARLSLASVKDWSQLTWAQVPSLLPLVFIYGLLVAFVLSGPSLPIWFLGNVPRYGVVKDWSFLGRPFGETDRFTYLTPYWNRVSGISLLAMALWSSALAYYSVRIQPFLSGLFTPWKEADIAIWFPRLAAFVAISSACWGVALLLL